MTRQSLQSSWRFGAPRRRRAARSLGAFVSLVVLGLFGSPLPASPQRAETATLTVGANVLQNCSVTVTDLHFGEYDPLLANAGAPLDIEATLSTVCTPDTWLLVEMDDGQNPLGNVRRMYGGTEFLDYSVFKDSGRTQRWGRANEGMLLQTPPGQIAPVFRTIYGRVPGGQNIRDGVYSDAIQVTLHF